MGAHPPSARDHPWALSDSKDAYFLGNSKAVWVTGGERLCLYEDAYLKGTVKTYPQALTRTLMSRANKAWQASTAEWTASLVNTLGLPLRSTGVTTIKTRIGRWGDHWKKKKKKVSQVLKCVCVSLSFHSPTQRLTSAARLRILRNLGVSDPVLVRISILARVLSSYLKIYMCIRVETWSCVFVLKILGMTISH